MAESKDSPPIVVCDAGPLIHLDQVACVELLTDFPRVLVPTTVWEEVIQHRPAALQVRTVRFIKTEPPESVPAELEALSRLLALHRGEQEALRVAEASPGCLLLTDDTAARLAGRNLGLPVHGTLGILVRAIRRKQKTKNEVLVILRSLPGVSTLHVRASLLEEVIRQVQQSE